MTTPNVEPDRAVERGKSKGAPSRLVAQHELHAPRAEAAAPVVEQ
jgi:hypothetical protein